MSKYNITSEKQILEQKLCNVISYILMLYRNNNISEKAKNDILKICNPDVYYKNRNFKFERKRRYEKRENPGSSNPLLRKQ